MENREEKRKKLFNGPSDRVIEIQCLEMEQEELKEQTPEEKAFRNYKCMFCWRYLLQVGFTAFFGTEDWKNEKAHQTFLRFDKKIWKNQPNRVRKFTEETEQYFRDNIEEIWVGKEILHKYLPKGYQNIGELRSGLAIAKSME